MRLDAPPDMARRFTRDVVAMSHDLHDSDLFDDDGLAELLDRYPRDQLGIYRFPDHGEGINVPDHGRADGVSGQDLVRAVKEGRIWLNLRAVNTLLDDYDSLANDLFAQFDDAAGQRTLKHDVGLLISSPHVNVHYHLDIPLVMLMQLRGHKRVWLYPPEPRFAPPENVEAIALREHGEELPFEASFDDHAQLIDLAPGDAITWPQNAPHRVQNGDMMNVSLSCEFMTLPALVRANAIHANGVLRRRAGLAPKLGRSLGPGTCARAALSRVFKLVLPSGEDRSRRSPVFEIDPGDPGRVRPIEPAAAA